MKHKTPSSVITSPDYRRFIEDLRTRVVSARISAARSVNRRQAAKRRQPDAKIEGGSASDQFLPQLVAEIRRGHHRLMLDKLSNSVAQYNIV